MYLIYKFMKENTTKPISEIGAQKKSWETIHFQLVVNISISYANTNKGEKLFQRVMWYNWLAFEFARCLQVVYINVSDVLMETTNSKIKMFSELTYSRCNIRHIVTLFKQNLYIQNKPLTAAIAMKDLVMKMCKCWNKLTSHIWYVSFISVSVNYSDVSNGIYIPKCNLSVQKYLNTFWGQQISSKSQIGLTEGQGYITWPFLVIFLIDQIKWLYWTEI